MNKNLYKVTLSNGKVYYVAAASISLAVSGFGFDEDAVVDCQLFACGDENGGELPIFIE